MEYEIAECNLDMHLQSGFLIYISPGLDFQLTGRGIGKLRSPSLGGVEPKRTLPSWRLGSLKEK